MIIKWRWRKCDSDHITPLLRVTSIGYEQDCSTGYLYWYWYWYLRLKYSSLYWYLND